MRFVLIPVLFVALGGCAATGPEPLIQTPSSSDYLLPPRANTAPRGSAEFCRIYGQQSANNRLRASSRSGGRGPNGFDGFLAREEGERAAARCAGRRPL